MKASFIETKPTIIWWHFLLAHACGLLWLASLLTCMRKYVHIFVLLKTIILRVATSYWIKPEKKTLLTLNELPSPSLHWWPARVWNIDEDESIRLRISLTFHGEYFWLCWEFRAEEIFSGNITLCGDSLSFVELKMDSGNTIFKSSLALFYKVSISLVLSKYPRNH